jgi:hypothetical protein
MSKNKKSNSKVNELLSSESVVSRLISFIIFAFCIALPAYMSNYIKASEAWKVLCPLLLLVGYSYVSYCGFKLKKVWLPGRYGYVLTKGKLLVLGIIIWYGALIAVSAVYVVRLTK